ncbi:MAG TPA: hypothetical protein VIK95_12970 [Egibacteraceae bacterium]
MGYTEAEITATDFRLPHEHEAAALDSVRAWLERDIGYDLEVADLDAAFRLFGITIERDPAGDVVGFEFDGVLLAETDDLFQGIAPWVVDGSTIDWKGGTGDRWRYVFADGVLQRTDPPS